MIKKRSSDESRIWARRDRSIVPINKVRGRTVRSAPTDAERKLWWHLRYRVALPDTHFRRQVQLGRYIVDFVCHSLKIVIEVDGGQHSEQSEHDARRSQFLEAEGYRVLRFWNNEVLSNIDGVMEVIQSTVLATPTPTPPHKGEGKERVF